MTTEVISDPEAPGAILTDQLRRQLSLNPALGAGNYLHYAYQTNPNAARALVFFDVPFRTFLGEEYTEFSLASLHKVTGDYAAWYLKAGVKPQDPVAVYLHEGIGYLVQYTALTSLGAIPILINGALDPRIAALYIQRMGGVGVFTDTWHYEQIQPFLKDDPSLNFLVSHEMLNGTSLAPLPAWYPYQHDYDDPIMITHTSGTTGIPKGVLLQHGKFFYGIRHLLALQTVKGTERILTSLPSSHNSAIAYAMHAILNGFAIMIVSDRSGPYVLKMIDRYHPGTIISFPVTYVDMCKSSMDDYDLQSVTLWMSSGDSSHEAHIRKLVKYGHHYRGETRIAGSQFVDGLGSSEMGHTLFRIVHTPYTNSYNRCVGFPQKWVEAMVLDEQGNELPANVVGRLGLKGPSVTSGYWNNSVLTYRSRLNGYWLTGDLVYKDDMKCFYHVDRISDAIPTRNGMFYSVQAEEFLLKNCPEIVDCTIVGVQEEDPYQVPLGLIQLEQYDPEFDASRLLVTLNELLAGRGLLPLYQVRIVAEGELPVGVTGKVLKRSLRERYSRLDALDSASS